ncbi:MAG: archemetzincin, partial [Methanobacteriota archaeon]
VATQRLDPIFYGEPPNPQLFRERTSKEVIHELGHTYGLGHCSRQSCVMHFSNTLLDTDRKSHHLCPSCRKLLGLI